MKIIKYSFLAMSLLFFANCGIGSSSTALAQEQAPVGQIQTTTKNDAALSNLANSIAVDAGFASNGTVITIPSGFTASQCKFTAAVANVDGSAISTYVAIQTTDPSPGKVICEEVVQERTEIPATTKNCVASYTIICIDPTK